MQLQVSMLGQTSLNRLTMYPVRVLSVNNGWEQLIYQKPEQWKEINEALLSITPDELLNNPEFRLKHTPGARFSDIVRAIELRMQALKWGLVRRSKKAPGVRLRRYIEQNGVALRVFIDSGFGDEQLSSDLLAKIPIALKAGIIDLIVILVPTDNFKALYKDIYTPSFTLTETKFRSQIETLKILKIESSIAIIFFSPEGEKLEIESLASIPKSNTTETFERSIEFASEYYQAGVSILSYFGQILRQNYPDMNAKVRIEQDGNTVRMHVESDTGIDIIEKELDKYALVIAEQAPPDSLFDNKLYTMQLEHKLDMANAEIKQAHNMNQLLESTLGKRIVDLEQQVHFVREQMATQLLQTGQVIHLATQQVGSHERIQLAQINHTSSLFKDLLGEAHGNQAVMEAIRSLQNALLSGIATIEMEDKVSAALTVVKQEQPSMLGRIAGQVEGAGYGALAGYALDWISKHMP
jgi:hypothetical protein